MLILPKHSNILQFNSFEQFKRVTTFSTTRRGGCSTGNYDSFNLSYHSGDERIYVNNNRVLLCNALRVARSKLFVPYQIHSDGIALIDDHFLSLSTSEQEAVLYGKDAVVTACDRIAIAVSTADCVPVVLYDDDKKVTAVVHAGWRSTRARILAKTVGLMIDTFSCSPQKIHAAIGPSISAGSFEVGEEVYVAFDKEGFDMRAFSFAGVGNDKFYIDLWKINRQELLLFGVPDRQIETAGICTFINSDSFFSARKLGVNSGRMLTGIVRF